MMKILFWFLIFPGFLFTAVIGLLLTWVDRKVSARIQWRVGPPWYQPFADFLKLLSKETLIPEGASRFVFLLAPILSVSAVTAIAVMLFYMNFNPTQSFVGDLIVLIYLLAIPPLATIIGASASKNPLSAIGASREMTLYFGYELPFLIAILTVVIKTGGLIRIGDIVIYQQINGPLLYSVSGIIAFIVLIICVQAKLGYVPFDIAEAEQELMAGVYTEYSGFALGLFKLSKAMMLFLLPCLEITLFWGGLARLQAIPEFLLLIVLIILIKNTNPRLRVDQALKFFWLGLTPLSMISIILAFLRL
ncbi:MAG: NADH-quinone oxidoreductase subunit H [candidate division WOR-3 bacterium]|nr:NADH-quinone oxidoreductase subunit H [candidate division WOR-3 bacterium]